MPDELDTGHGHTHAHLARRFELHVAEIFVVSITTIYPPPPNRRVPTEFPRQPSHIARPHQHRFSALYRGTTRQRTVSVTVDGTLVRTWESSGTTDDFEVVDLTGNDGGLLGNLASFGVSGQVVQITGDLEPNEWLSIVEVQGKGATLIGVDRAIASLENLVRWLGRVAAVQHSLPSRVDCCFLSSISSFVVIFWSCRKNGGSAPRQAQ